MADPGSDRERVVGKQAPVGQEADLLIQAEGRDGTRFIPGDLEHIFGGSGRDARHPQQATEPGPGNLGRPGDQHQNEPSVLQPEEQRAHNLTWGQPALARSLFQRAHRSGVDEKSISHTECLECLCNRSGWHARILALDGLRTT